MEKLRYPHDGVEYIANIDRQNDRISYELINKHKKNVPEFLYKYYDLKSYNIGALRSGYLFASHPDSLNDKYDCSTELIDFSDLSINTYLGFLVNDLRIYTEEQVKELFYSDKKWVLERTAADLNNLRLFLKIGIISLTENPTHTLMWAYYSNNRGFSIKIDPSFLIDKGDIRILGCVPINYIEKLHKINLEKYGAELTILYQSSTKDKIWQKENEWRYILFNKKGMYHPEYFPKDIKSRFYYYDKRALKEITLGYNFFDLKEIDFRARTNEYDLVNFNKKKKKSEIKSKRKILNFIINNDIPCSQIFKSRNGYELSCKKIKIEKISSNKFRIYNKIEE